MRLPFLPASSVPPLDTAKISEITRDLQNTAWFFSVFQVIGLACVWIRAGWDRSAATPILWALACLAVGSAVGFLFGIPKILQGDGRGNGTSGNGNRDANAPAGQTPIFYRQRVNTNLEEISDWLTKIIVGLGLVNLANIPPTLSRIADVLARELHPPGQKAFALALILYFTVIGLLYGYLFTRLFLQRAFARADLAALGERDPLRQAIDRGAQHALAANPEAGKEPTDEQREAAQQVAEVAQRSDLSAVRQQITELAREYETIRASMPSSFARTQLLYTVVTKMRTLAIAAAPLLPELIHSPSAGQCLAAIAILQVKPDPAYLGWLAERIAVEQPFVQYQAAVALLYAVRALGDSYREPLQQAITQAKEALGPATPSSDRYKTLNQAEQELSQHQADT